MWLGPIFATLFHEIIIFQPYTKPDLEPYWFLSRRHGLHVPHDSL